MREWSHQVLLMFEWHLSRQVHGILQPSPWKALSKNREIAGVPHCRVKGLAVPLAQMGELTHKHKHGIWLFRQHRRGWCHQLFIMFEWHSICMAFWKALSKNSENGAGGKRWCTLYTRSTHESSSIASHRLAFAHFQWDLNQASNLVVVLIYVYNVFHNLLVSLLSHENMNIIFVLP